MRSPFLLIILALSLYSLIPTSQPASQPSIRAFITQPPVIDIVPQSKEDNKTDSRQLFLRLMFLSLLKRSFSLSLSPFLLLLHFLSFFFVSFLIFNCFFYYFFLSYFVFACKFPLLLCFYFFTNIFFIMKNVP